MSKPVNPYACKHERKFGRCPCDFTVSMGKANRETARAWEDGYAAGKAEAEKQAATDENDRAWKRF